MICHYCRKPLIDRHGPGGITRMHNQDERCDGRPITDEEFQAMLARIHEVAEARRIRESIRMAMADWNAATDEQRAEALAISLSLATDERRGKPHARIPFLLSTENPGVGPEGSLS